MSKFFDDVDDTGVDAGDQTQQTEPYDDNVLPQAPVQSTQARFFPTCDQIDAARYDQTQEGQTQCPDQRYHWPQVRYGDRDAHCNTHKIITILLL